MKPNVLLINLPYRPVEFLVENAPGKSMLSRSPLTMPMGILYVSSYLKAHNDVGSVSLLDYRAALDGLSNYRSLEEFFREEARKGVSFAPDVIGVSLNFSLSHGVFEMVMKQLKALWPKAVTVVGGNHATNVAWYLLAHGSADYVLRGEGEIAFSELVRQFAEGRPIDVRGVYRKGAPVDRKDLVLASPVQDLDSMPFPDWDLLDMERYVTQGRRRALKEDEAEARVATLLTTRGCPFMCTFCSAHTVHGRKVRTRSEASVVREVETLYKKYGVTAFVVEDDLFTASKKRLLSILEAVHALNIPGLDFQTGNGVSVNATDEGILDALIKVGARSITIAIESGSLYVQKHLIKKNVNLRKVRDVVRWCHDRSLIVRAFIMFGFAGETKEHMNETVQYMKDLGADWYVINLATPLPGTEMYDQFLSKDCFKEDVAFWSQTITSQRAFDTAEITGAELTEFGYRVNLEVNFLNNVNLRNGNYDRAIALFSDMAKLYPFHIFAWYGLHQAYKQKGDMARSAEALQKIKSLLATDSRSREMHEKYGSLLAGAEL
jgi:radical SAM superfamily enzyme YgiQ (UPF0313 family)